MMTRRPGALKLPDHIWIRVRIGYQYVRCFKCGNLRERITSQLRVIGNYHHAA